jgi:hypothetical protein
MYQMLKKSTPHKTLVAPPLTGDFSQAQSVRLHVTVTVFWGHVVAEFEGNWLYKTKKASHSATDENQVKAESLYHYAAWLRAVNFSIASFFSLILNYFHFY